MCVSHTYRISFQGPLAGSFLVLVGSRAANPKWWSKNWTKNSRLRSRDKGRLLLNLSLSSVPREKESTVNPTGPYFRVGWHHLTRSALRQERKREKQRKRMWGFPRFRMFRGLSFGISPGKLSCRCLRRLGGPWWLWYIEGTQENENGQYIKKSKRRKTM